MTKNPNLSTLNSELLTILVTGGAGYIGSIATKELCDAGYEVVVLDSLENGHKEAVDKRAVLEVADLANKERVDEIFKKHKPAAVIDFAAYLAVGESMEKPEKYLQNNVLNFINLLDIMKDNGCKFIIKSSTASVYGNPIDSDSFPLKEIYTNEFVTEESCLTEGKWQGKMISGHELFAKFLDSYHENIGNPFLSLTEDETAQLRIPTSIYGLSKLLDEIVMNKYDNEFGLRYISLRYFNVGGAIKSAEMGEDKPNPTNILTVSIYKALGKRDSLSVFGNDYPTKDGTGIRDYIHVTDLALGHIKALDYLIAQQNSEIINLGTGKGYSVLEVINAVEKVHHQKIDYKIEPRRLGDLAVSYSDPSKADKLLGWRAKYSLEEMAETAYKWHKSHPHGYSTSLKS